MRNLRLKNRSIVNPHRTLPHSLGVVRTSRSFNFTPARIKITRTSLSPRDRLFLNNPYLWSVPGCIFDPKNKSTYLTETQKQKRFLKWMAISQEAQKLYWRARGLTKKFLNIR